MSNDNVTNNNNNNNSSSSNADKILIEEQKSKIDQQDDIIKRLMTENANLKAEAAKNADAYKQCINVSSSFNIYIFLNIYI